MKLAAAFTVALALTACASSSPRMAGNAAIWTGVAGAAALAERSAGGCYAACVSGMACNTRTGLCEPTRCAGCTEGQTCFQDEYGSRCVTRQVPLGVTTSGAAPDPRRNGAVVIGVPTLPTPAPHHASDQP